MTLCREIGALYIDTVVEPWLGFYFDKSAGAGEALQLRAARDRARRQAQAARAAPPRSPPAAPIPAWCRGSSSRRCSTSPATPALPFNEPKSREGWARADAQKLGVKGIHIAERDTQRSKKPKPIERVRQHLVGRRLRVGRHAAGRTRLGHPRKMDAGQRPPAHERLRRRDLSAAARRQYPRPLLVPDAGRAIRLPRHPQRIDLDRRLLHGARRRARWCTARPATTPITRPTTPCCRCTRCSAPTGKMQPTWHILDENEIVDGIDELGVLVYGHAKNAYWYGSQLSIEETRELAPVPERHRPAGVLGRARRHGVGAGKPERRHRRGRRDGLSAAASKCRGRISARSRATTPTGPRSAIGPGCSPRTSTRRIRGSSGTCWCAEHLSESFRGGRSEAAGEPGISVAGKAYS